MKPIEHNSMFTHSLLDAGAISPYIFDRRFEIKNLASNPNLVKQLFVPETRYHLEPAANRAEYLSYLSEVTGLNPGFTGEDVVEALKIHPEKAVAHTILALSGITEDESHIIPLTDTDSIIDYAYYLYEAGELPWFDFVVQEDVVKKTATEINGKKSAPLFRKCTNFADFIRDVIPTIKEYQEKDPAAFLKIFPQTKNVETFNMGINHKPDGSSTWIVEWHPGAYTPREGEDSGGRVLIKDRKKDKEERIVRIIIEFDKDGQAVAFVKPPRDQANPDSSPPPLQFPIGNVDLKTMFVPATIDHNHDSMASSNDPFVLLKYISTHPGFQELLTKFHTLHAKLGYADLVLSGMIGPDTVFGMDIDFGTPAEFSSAADYIANQIRNVKIQPHSIFQSFIQLQQAPIFDERDGYSLRIIPYTLEIIRDFIKISEETKMIWITGLNAVLNLFSDVKLSEAMKIYSQGAIIENWPQLTQREISILLNTSRAYENYQSPRRKIAVEGKSPFLKGRSPLQTKKHRPSEAIVQERRGLYHPAIVQTESVYHTPKHDDAILAINRVKTDKAPKLVSPKKVSDL